jgi:hypothetical protein
MKGAKSFARKRKREVRRNRNRNVHHIWPRSRQGGNDPENLVEVDRRVHSAYHRVFGNQTPREAFIYASQEPYTVAARIITALVAEFGLSILGAAKIAA